MTESQPQTSPTSGKLLFPLLDYVSFDPGKRTGVCGWLNPAASPVMLTVLLEKERDELIVWLREHPPKILIYEPYAVFNNVYNHQGDEVYTAQVIGQLLSLCREKEIEAIKVGPELKKVAARQAGVTIPKGHMPDQVSAFLIGYYHLRKIGLIPSRVLQERGAIK